MIKKFVFMDIETPNRRNASVCQVGALLVDASMNVLKEYNQLIDPHEAFDPINISVHGITASDVSGCPCFEDFYTSELKALLNDAFVVNHNVSFDINVLNKAICNHDLPFPTTIRTIDTLAIAQALYSNVENYKLDTLCKVNGISFKHHDALSDARAAYELYKIMRSNPQVLAYTGSEYCWLDKGHTERVVSKALVPAMTDLYGSIIGIKLDSVIKNSEINALKTWMHENARYASTPIFENVFELLQAVIADGVLTFSKCEQILTFVSPFVSSATTSDVATAENILKGIIRGVVADKQVNFTEAVRLLEWRNRYSDLRLNNTYELLFDKVYESVEDKTITSCENDELVRLCEFILNPAGGKDELQSLCATDLNGATVVLTGEFDHGTRNSVSKDLKERGFEVAQGVSKKTNYVVIGNKGSESYANGNYGTKVKKAMNYGIPVIAEDDFYMLLEDR